MRCLACNDNLTDKEAGRKYTHWREIKNPEERYVGLCTGCLKEAGIEVLENPLLEDVVYQDERPASADPEQKLFE